MNSFNFNNSYIDIDERIFSRVKPERPKEPKVILYNRELADKLDIKEREPETYLSGLALPEGGEVIAQAYAGHQFGYLNILGDGRALLLGEHIDGDGSRWDIQLKGSGRTPYSRGGDGKATLKSMLREYLISHAMEYLGIPTTRSLAVIETGNPVYREDVNRGAVLTRVAKSHIRVGTFQYIAMQGDIELLKNFTDYTIKRHYPEIINHESRYLELLKKVMSRQIDLIIEWMRVGFIHGVMNTDNVAISGETIDYGPCAFMDIYNPKTVFSSIDKHGRYCFTNQEYIGQWNIARFAETLIPLIDHSQERALEQVNRVVEEYREIFSDRWYQMMGRKLGLKSLDKRGRVLIGELLKLMEDEEMDYTLVFHTLDQLKERTWFNRWMELHPDRKIMERYNPRIIPRNHIVEEVLEKADRGDMDPYFQFLEVLKDPYSIPESNYYREAPSVVDHNYRTFCGT